MAAATMAIPLDEYLGVPGQHVRLVHAGPAPTSPALVAIASAAAWLELLESDTPSAEERLLVEGSRPHGRIEWVGAVKQRQLGPLVETIRALGTGEVELDTPATAGRVQDFERDVVLQVVVSSSCPYCPAVASAALRLAVLSTRVSVVVLSADATKAPAQVSSVPSVLLDGRLLVAGPIGEYALADRVVKGD